VSSLRLAVVGDPVAHSRSPEIFRAMLSSANRDGTYEAIRVEAGDGARAFAELRARGFTGLNVTTPLKEEALRASDDLDDIARAAGSVNVLVLGERFLGYNTDGAGALGALAAAGLGNLRDKRVLVLGAGPTARAAIVAIRKTEARVAIWNRTHARAQSIVEAHGAEPFDRHVTYDAILSTLSPGATPHDVGLDVTHAITTAANVIDANYGSRSTLAATFNRPSITDGFEMLHASARASYAIFAAARTP